MDTVSLSLTFVFVQGVCLNFITVEILDILFLSNSSLEREGAALCDQYRKI